MDALIPPEIAQKAEDVGEKKANMPLFRMFALSVLAGAFIALGAIFSTTVVAGSTLPFGVTRLLGGLSFSLGLVLVVVGGAELFTGNSLIVMAWASGRVRTGALLRNWAVVFAGNAVGAVGTAALNTAAGQFLLGGGVVGETALRIAQAKLMLPWGQAFALGVLCNALVCLAVWMSMGARSTSDRVLAVVFPVAAFVTSGFEHSVANLYFVPYALMVQAWAGDGFWQSIASSPAAWDLDLWAFVWRNLVPVILGNVVGGGALVGGVYWAVYLRDR